MVEDQRRHRRRSIRLKGYDYTRDGAYFVTICAQDRSCVFGAVVDGEMRLNEYGRKVADRWLWLAEQYPYVGLDEWVVMPNHIHGIIVITDDRGGGADADDRGRGGSGTAPTDPRDTPTTGFTGQSTAPGTHGIRTAPTLGPRDIPMGPGWPPTEPVKRKPLGRLIGAFKTVSTKHVNEIRSASGAKLWQRNYYEHVIRDDSSLRRIREYIANNPSQWELDRENPARLP